VFFQSKFQIPLCLTNIEITTRTFKFVYDIASFQMCLFVLILTMISDHVCSMNERQLSKFFQIYLKKVSQFFF